MSTDNSPLKDTSLNDGTESQNYPTVFLHVFPYFSYENTWSPKSTSLYFSVQVFCFPPDNLGPQDVVPSDSWLCYIFIKMGAVANVGLSRSCESLGSPWCVVKGVCMGMCEFIVINSLAGAKFVLSRRHIVTALLLVTDNFFFYYYSYLYSTFNCKKWT